MMHFISYLLLFLFVISINFHVCILNRTFFLSLSYEFNLPPNNRLEERQHLVLTMMKRRTSRRERVGWAKHWRRPRARYSIVYCVWWWIVQ